MPEVKKTKHLKLVNFSGVVGLSDLKEIYISDGKLISENKIINKSIFENIDAKNCVVSPGFIDIQVNGFEECDFWTIAKKDKNSGFKLIDDLRLKFALKGIVAFCPTIITAPVQNIIDSINFINEYIKYANPDTGSRILGIHIEGVFITKLGVHDERYVRKTLTVQDVKPFVKPNVLIFTLAPELDNSGNAIAFLQKSGIVVSIGHSNASYKEAEEFLNKHNLSLVTHMFNALRGIEGFSHRGDVVTGLDLLKSKLASDEKINQLEDGIILSILKNKNILCTVIADGVHMHKDVVKFLWGVKGPSLFALASDVVSKKLFNKKNILSGSEITLEKCVANLIEWKVSSLENCLRAASESVSGKLKIALDLGLGKLSFDKEANIVLWDKSINSVKGTIIGENIFLNY